MNKNFNKHFRYFLIPFLIAVILIAAVSISDSYNSGLFPAGYASAAGNVMAANTPDADAVNASGSVLTSGADSDSVRERENAPHIAEPDYESDYYIVVFLKTQNVIVYGKGSGGGYNQVVKCFTCSSGKPGHETRTGLYSIIRRYRWRLLVGDVYGQYSTGFSSSYLFHSVPYLVDGDPSTLDEAEYDKLGQPASKGCIRLCVRDTKWIFENCPDGTQVNIVDDSNETQGEQILPRLEGKRYEGWDPSDPDPDSPYNTPD